jgi:hypothetical protein
MDPAGSKSGFTKTTRDQKTDIAHQKPAESAVQYNNLELGKVFLAEAGFNQG